MKMKLSSVEEYRRCAVICSQTDYGSSERVRRHNATARKMRSLVEKAKELGPQALSEFFVLLDDPHAGPWLAHQLLEECQVPTETEFQCMELIRKRSEGPDGLAERMWLTEYKKKKGNQKQQ